MVKMLRLISIFVIIQITIVFGKDPRCTIENFQKNLPNPSDVTQFYKCGYNGNVIKLRCKNGMIFDELKASCVLITEENSISTNYETRIASNFEMICPRDGSSKYFANRAEGCRSFYICDNGMARITPCRGNLLFNEEINSCDWPVNVRCPCEGPNCGVWVITTTPPTPSTPSTPGTGDDTTTCTCPTPTTTTTTTCTCPTTTTPCNCPPNGQPPTPTPTPPNGQPPTPTPTPPHGQPPTPCPPILPTAPPPLGPIPTSCAGQIDGKSFPNILDGCRTYYVCDHGISKLFNCGNGLLFNRRGGYCDWATNVVCN